jgi:hypothetical protein
LGDAAADLRLRLRPIPRRLLRQRQRQGARPGAHPKKKYAHVHVRASWVPCICSLQFCRAQSPSKKQKAPAHLLFFLLSEPRLVKGRRENKRKKSDVSE